MSAASPRRAGEWLRAAERNLPLVAELDPLLGPAGGVLVLAPHPDDESLGCGGLLAACAADRRPARVVVVSDGAGSHPRSQAYPPARLSALRQGEARAAVAALGLDPLRDIAFLGLPDTAVPSAGPAFEAAVAALLRLADPAPGAVLVTWRHDPHCDHAASFAMAAALVRALPAGTRLYAYPVWGLAFAHPLPGFPLPPEPLISEPPRGIRLDITRHLPAKRRAVAAHVSQVSPLVTDDPQGFRLPPEALALAFRPTELFLEVDFA
ncbi:PIG-L deacetylase family protein [Belnapia sp. F-4-1]|uniref:PIG-L deacetylase family protein n=1 Tax=Belnapia sp. F-4-1 TaxID=1545443 RepID=UPI0005BA093E|nr:PIG-L deacetylase family protein [Belnapia sp. F-4-1]